MSNYRIRTAEVYDLEEIPNLAIDDFVVNEDNSWETVDADLLHQVKKAALLRGATQLVVVCGHLDQPKRKVLEKSSLTIASEWWGVPLKSNP